MKNARGSVSRVLSLPKGIGRPFLSDDACASPPATNPDGGREHAPEPKPHAIPIRSCSRWGLPCRRRYRKRGALLPHPFTLTPHVERACPPAAWSGLLSVALSLGSPPPGVTRHRCSAEPGLSSTWQSTTRPPDPLTRPPYSSPIGLGRSRASRIIRHSASTSPSTSSGRKRRWKAMTAAIRSVTS